jgi:hypothetical protein
LYRVAFAAIPLPPKGAFAALQVEKTFSLALQFMKRRVSVGRVRMALSLVSPAQWQGGHLDTYCEVWVIISFEHPRKGEIRGGVVVFAVAPNNGGDEWKYIVRVPGVGYVIGLQPTEISPVQFGKPSGIEVCSGAFLFKSRNAKKCGGSVKIVRCDF